MAQDIDSRASRSSGVYPGDPLLLPELLDNLIDNRAALHARRRHGDVTTGCEGDTRSSASKTPARVIAAAERGKVVGAFTESPGRRGKARASGLPS